MLKQIQVSGFKSLDGFDLEFRPGLNVLVGPNGSGKTNIINFLEFLSFLSRGSLLEAVGRSGGAGNIFRRQTSGRLQRQIRFRLIGEGRFQEMRREISHLISYQYEASVVLSDNKSSIFFDQQRFRLRVLDENSALEPMEPEWGLDVETNSRGDQQKTDVHFHRLEEIFVAERVTARKSESIETLTEMMEEQLGESCANHAIFQIIGRQLRQSRVIVRDLLSAKSFNISPSVVRTPEDIASEAEIASNGGGLAATMFMLKNASGNSGSEYYYEDSDAREILRKIVEYSRLVNDSILNITVEPDTIENKLRIFLTVKYRKGRLKLPFSLVSDGTAKWFALVTAILMSPSIFAIEEPENYLHPLMQREIVNIVRAAFEFENRDVFALMTTHSETILNCIDPDEMILVHMENGRTFARRPENAEDIREEIQRSGFGAGYYYIAGAIE